MRVHIWIRKENEVWWEENGSSGWVNGVIIKLGKPSSARKDKDYIEALVNSDDGLNYDTCKHGFAKGNCKHESCNKGVS